MNQLLDIDITLPLDQFTLEVKYTSEKQVSGVFGVSGSGKTSLLEAIAGLRTDSVGRVQLGREVWQDSKKGIFVPTEKRGIGYVSQDLLLFPHKNVRANLLAGARRALRAGLDVDQLLTRVTRLLNIQGLQHRDVFSLSGGERQRVALGRAICSGPKLLLLDEPLASLDIPLRRRVLPFLRKIREEFDIPMMVVSHNPVEVQALCDDLIAIREGRIITAGIPRAVLTNPEVFPVAEQEGFQNVLSGRILRHEADTSVICPGDKSCPVEIYTREAKSETGSPVQIGVPANDIIIAVEKPVLTSARNILEATIVNIETFDNFRLVIVNLHESVPDLAVEVTSKSMEQLELIQGKQIYLIIKTVSWTLYESQDT